MKRNLRQAGIFVAILGTAAIATAAVIPAISIHPESRIWVEGTSTVRDYSCEAAEVLGSVDAAATTLSVAELDGAVRGAELSIATSGLECGNGTMNSHMRKALKANQHTAIQFRLATYQATLSGSGETTVKMKGTLEIAGQERPMEIDAIATPADNGGLRVKGTKEFLMSEFGVKPPSLMLGTMKVRDQVKVNFDVVLRP